MPPQHPASCSVSNHSKLVVWHRANALSLGLHRAAASFPVRGAPGLKSQLLRAAGSIPANIAEGAAFTTNTQFVHFITIAIGSANELETHLLVADGLGILPDGASFRAETIEIRRMLLGLRKYLIRNP